MSETAIDIAWDRPTVAEIKATGAIGVLRYFSTDSTKNLTAAEVAEYHAAGLATGDVWETTTGRATQGYQAGVDDAGLAEAQRKADGLPPNQVVYFAVDEDTDWASVEPYFRGASDVLGKQRVGVYGGLRVIEGAYAAGYRYLWQTLAWSGGQVSAHAVLYQDGRTVLGGAADINQVLAPDWGQYPSPSGGDMPLTDADAAVIWNHLVTDNATKKPVSVGTIMAWMDTVHGDQNSKLAALTTALASLGTAVASIGTAVGKLGTADAQILADLQAAQAALAGIPAQVDAALKDGTVHVDVSVTGPAPAKP